MFKILVGIMIALASLGPALAEDDASMRQVYEAANSGHLAQAQEMIGKVLQDHPTSAKAHYVAAEIDARQGRFGGAREQLQAAERLAPGLPFAKPEAVAALRAELGAASRTRADRPPVSTGMMIFIGVGIGLLILLLVRRLRPPAPAGFAAAYPQPGTGYAPAVGAPPGTGGGVGSGIAGGLVSGLAVGAGVVAGEALMHRLMDGGERGVDQSRLGDTSQEDLDRRGNADMGGNDFGVADTNSWDDGSSSLSDSGGTDDWT